MAKECPVCLDLWEKAVAAIGRHHKLHGCARIATLNGDLPNYELSSAIEEARIDRERALFEYTAHTRTHAPAPV